MVPFNLFVSVKFFSVPMLDSQLTFVVSLKTILDFQSTSVALTTRPELLADSKTLAIWSFLMAIQL